LTVLSSPSSVQHQDPAIISASVCSTAAAVVDSRGHQLLCQLYPHQLARRVQHPSLSTTPMVALVPPLQRR
jgi:hypothetical protein